MCVSEYIVDIFSTINSGIENLFGLKYLGLTSRTLGADLRTDFRKRESAGRQLDLFGVPPHHVLRLPFMRNLILTKLLSVLQNSKSWSRSQIRQWPQRLAFSNSRRHLYPIPES